MNYAIINLKNLDKYNEEIAAIPLLDPPAERRLTTIIQQARQEEKNALLKQQEPDSQLLQKGKQARNHMIEANLRLVVYIINQNFSQINVTAKGANNVHFVHSQQLQSMTRLDLIEAGNLGLIQAVDSFDVNRGNAFSTYATTVVKNAILAAIYKEDRLIRLPAYKEDEVRQASIEGTTEYLPYDLKEILYPISIDTPIVLSDPDVTIEGILSEADESLTTSPIDEFITRQDRYELARTLLEILTPRERYIAVMLFVEGITDSELARHLGVTRVRIGQIKKAIQAKLKAELDRLRITASDIFDIFD